MTWRCSSQRLAGRSRVDVSADDYDRFNFSRRCKRFGSFICLVDEYLVDESRGRWPSDPRRSGRTLERCSIIAAEALR